MKDLEAQLAALEAHARDKVIALGMEHGGLMLLRDSIMQEPMVPLDEGTLKASGSVHVDGKPTATSADVGAASGTGTPVTGSISGSPSMGQAVATVGFNTPYAAHLHEHPEYEFTQPGHGGEYLSQKIEQNGNAYLGAIADGIRQGLGDLLK